MKQPDTAALRERLAERNQCRQGQHGGHHYRLYPCRGGFAEEGHRRTGASRHPESPE